MAELAIRPARTSDAQAIAAIYQWHVAHGTATFDTVAPDAAAWAEKLADFAARELPFLVAERGGEVVAYAYAARVRDRAAEAGLTEAWWAGQEEVIERPASGLRRVDRDAHVVYCLRLPDEFGEARRS